MDVQKHYDFLMCEDYKKILKDLEYYKADVQSIANKLKFEKNKNTNTFYIIDDLIHIIDTLECLYISCRSFNGNRNSFFPFTTFYREFMITSKIINNKLKFLTENCKSAKSLKSDYNNLNKLVEQELKWRNKIEHDIDPFYDGDFFNIKSELNIYKIITYCKKNYEFYEKLSTYPLSTNDYTKTPVNYKAINASKRKELIAQSGYSQYEIANIINVLSYKSALINDKEFKNHCDLGFKILELYKSLTYLYFSNSSYNSYTGFDLNYFSYFIRISIVLEYQLFDKLGLYLSLKNNLNIKFPYFKDVIKKIIKEKTEYNIIIDSLIKLSESDDYKKLNKIRQQFVHKKTTIDFYENYDILSSLCIKIFVKLQELVLIILKDYMEKKAFYMTDKSIREVLDKTTINII